DMQMKSWTSGAFRLADNEITSDGEQILTLTDINLSGDGGRQRPRAEFRTASASFRVRQLAWWQIAPSGSTLNEQLVFQITKGRLHQIQLQVPAAWEVEKAELVPPDLARTQTIIQEDSGTLLSIDLQRPLVAAEVLKGSTGAITSPARLSVVLHSRQPGLANESILPFPDVVPIDAAFREGYLAISVDPL